MSGYTYSDADTMPRIGRREPCELHGLGDCSTCYRAHDDECNIGSCRADATHLIARPREGRRVCAHHATAPHWGILRAGASVRPLSAA